MLLERLYETIIHFLHLLLIAGRTTTKEIYMARCYIAKGSGADDNIGTYWKVGIGWSCYHSVLLFNRAKSIPKQSAKCYIRKLFNKHSGKQHTFVKIQGYCIRGRFDFNIIGKIHRMINYFKLI